MMNNDHDSTTDRELPTREHETRLGRVMYKCPNCRVIDSSTYNGPGMYWTLLAGNFIQIGDTRIPLSNDFLPCSTHLDALEKIRYPEEVK